MQLIKLTTSTKLVEAATAFASFTHPGTEQADEGTSNTTRRHVNGSAMIPTPTATSPNVTARHKPAGITASTEGHLSALGNNGADLVLDLLGGRR